MQKYIKKLNKKSLEKSLEDIWNNNKNDPNGSYTGTPDDFGKPVQDADDLWFCQNMFVWSPLFWVIF